MEDELLRRLTELRKRTGGANPEDPQAEQLLTTTTSLTTTTRFSASVAPQQSSAGLSSADRGSSKAAVEERIAES